MTLDSMTALSPKQAAASAVAENPESLRKQSKAWMSVNMLSWMTTRPRPFFLWIQDSPVQSLCQLHLCKRESEISLCSIVQRSRPAHWLQHYIESSCQCSCKDMLLFLSLHLGENDSHSWLRKQPFQSLLRWSYQVWITAAAVCVYACNL